MHEPDQIQKRDSWVDRKKTRTPRNTLRSSSRIFVKILCQELAEHLGLATLRDRFQDQYMAEVFGGMRLSARH